MKKDDKESQKYPEFLNELREDMSAKGLTSKELDEILNDELAFFCNRYKLFNIGSGGGFTKF